MATLTPAPDLFTNVHKGLRKALFDLVLALGRAAPSPADSAAERALAREVVNSLRLHGENEDLFILPFLQGRAPVAFRRLEDAHAAVAAELGAFDLLIDGADTPTLYQAACHLTALYLEHMNLEEAELEKPMRAALTGEQLAAVGPRSMARTPEELRRKMLVAMLAAMSRADGDQLLARLPPPLAAQLRSPQA